MDKDSIQAKHKDNIVFFDDLCVLCSGTILLLTKLDKKRTLKYSSLKGTFAQSLEDLRNLNSGQSVIIWSEGNVYDRADAVIHILFKLGGMYKLAGIFLNVFPLFVLNGAYDFIARHRYRIFGKRAACLVPSPEMKDLFIP